MTDALDRCIDDNKERFPQELLDLCAIPSEAVDPAALDRAARWCDQRMQAAGCRTHEVRVADVPPLAVGEVGSGKRTLIAVQHYDVQPAVPLELWTSPPYEPTKRDGAVYARGVSDKTGYLLLRIKSVDAHRAVLGAHHIQLRCYIEAEQDGASVNLHRLLDKQPALFDGDGALKEGGVVDPDGRPSVSCGNKGICYVQLRVRTLARDAH